MPQINSELTLGQVGKEIGRTYRRVRQLVAEGRLAAVNIGDTKRGPSWRVPASEVERYLRERKVRK